MKIKNRQALLGTFCVTYINRTQGSAYIEASSQDEALERLQRGECEFGDQIPMEPEITHVAEIDRG